MKKILIEFAFISVGLSFLLMIYEFIQIKINNLIFKKPVINASLDNLTFKNSFETYHKPSPFEDSNKENKYKLQISDSVLLKNIKKYTIIFLLFFIIYCITPCPRNWAINLFIFCVIILFLIYTEIISAAYKNIGTHSTIQFDNFRQKIILDDNDINLSDIKSIRYKREKSPVYIISRFYPYILNGQLTIILKNNKLIRINIQSYDTEKVILKELENYTIKAEYNK